MGIQISNINSVYEAYSVEKLNVKGKVGKSDSKKDTVNLSSEARDFNVATSVLSKIPDVRMDKVNKIKAQIENGTYNVTASDIADKLINEYFI